MANRVEELCSKLESHEFLDTSEYGYAEENKAILEEEILPELSALRDIFSNNDASVVSMSSIILGDDPSQVSKEDLATIATGLMSSGTDDSISKIFKDEISNAISAISKTSIIDNNPEIFRTTIMDQVHAVADIVKGSNVMASENEVWEKISEKCESVLASNLEKLPDNVKEQLAEADVGIFSYGKDQDGNIDKSVLVATPDMKLKDNGSLSNQFGITFQGKLCGIVSDPKAAGIIVEKLATIMNNAFWDRSVESKYAGRDSTGYRLIESNDIDLIKDAIFLKGEFSSGEREWTPDSAQQEALDKFGEALQRLYGVSMVDPDKLDKVINDAMDKADGVEKQAFEKAAYDEKAENDEETSSDRTKMFGSAYEWNDDEKRSDDQSKMFRNDWKNDEKDAKKTNPVDDDDDKKKSKAAETAEASQHGRSIIWQKTGNENVDKFIDKRNSYINNSPLYPIYRKQIGYTYAEMKAVLTARSEGVEINGQVPTALDCYMAFSNFLHTNIIDSVILSVILGASDLLSNDKGDNATNDKKEDVDINGRTRAAADAKAEQTKELTKDKLHSSIEKMASNITDALKKDSAARTDADRRNLGRTSGAYYNTVKDIIRLYGKTEGAAVVRDIIGKALKSAISDPKVTTDAIGRLCALLERGNIINIDGEKISLDIEKVIKDVFQQEKDKTDSDKEKTDNDNQDQQDKADADEDREESDNTDQKEPDGADREEADDADQEEPDDTDQEEADGADQEEPDDANREEPDDADQEESDDADREEPDDADQEEADDTDQEESDSIDQKGDRTLSADRREPVLSKEETALKNKLESMPKDVSAKRVANDPDVKRLVGDIRKVAGNQNISDSIAKVVASVSLGNDTSDGIDAKMKNVSKGMESITKANGSSVKIINIISKARNVIKEMNQPIGIISPGSRIVIELTDKFSDYMESKIPISTIRTEVKAYFDNATGKISGFLSNITSALNNVVSKYGSELKSNDNTIVSRIENIMNSISSVTGISAERVGGAIEKGIKGFGIVCASGIIAFASYGGGDIIAADTDRMEAQLNSLEKEMTDDNLSAEDHLSDEVKNTDEIDGMENNLPKDVDQSEDNANAADADTSNEWENNDTSNDETENRDKTESENATHADAADTSEEDRPDSVDRVEKNQPEDTDSSKEDFSNDTENEPDRMDAAEEENHEDVERAEEDFSDNTENGLEDIAVSEEDRSENVDLPEEDVDTDGKETDTPEEDPYQDMDQGEEKFADDIKDEPDNADDSGKDQPEDIEQQKDDLSSNVEDQSDMEPEAPDNIEQDTDAPDSVDPSGPEDMEQSATDTPDNLDQLENDFPDNREIPDAAEVPEADPIEDTDQSVDNMLDNSENGTNSDMTAPEKKEDNIDAIFDNAPVVASDEDTEDTHTETSEQDALDHEMDLSQADIPEDSADNTADGITGDAIDGQIETDVDLSGSEMENAGDGVENTSMDFRESEQDEKNNTTDDGISEAATAYAEEPDFGFDDFLSSPITVQGEETTIGEAIDNDMLSSQDIADAVAESISDHAEDILSDNALAGAYGDLLADIMDSVGNDFSEHICDSMDPFSSVNDVVYDAFDKVSDNIPMDDFQPDLDSGLDVFDLADLEFSIMDSIDDAGVLDVEAAALDFEAGQNPQDAGVDSENAMDLLNQTTIDTGMDNNTPDMELSAQQESPDTGFASDSALGDAVNASDTQIDSNSFADMQDSGVDPFNNYYNFQNDDFSSRNDDFENRED